MAGFLPNHEEFKTNVKNDFSLLLEKFSRREELLEKAMKDLEVSQAKFNEEMKIAWQKFDEEVKEQRHLLEEERLKLEKEKSFMTNIYEIQNSHIKLDVGGHFFSTSLATLTRDKSSMLAVMFSGRHKMIPTSENTYFIDRDGTYFKYVLNYLRGDLSPDTLPEDRTILKHIYRDADYFQLPGLSKIIEEALISSATLPANTLTQDQVNSLFSNRSNDLNPLNHKNTRNMTRSNLNFDKQNLCSLSFIHTAFVHNVSFVEANLRLASFYGCEFGSNVRIDFTNANLNGADFRQCRAFNVGQHTNGPSHKPPLYGASCSRFLKLIHEKKLLFKGSLLEDAKFDPGVLDCILQFNQK